MVTKTRQVVNEIGNAGVVFNDKLADGRRSLKVWGWTRSEYVLAANKLREMGCKVEVVNFKRRVPGRAMSKVTIRLHVEE